MFDTDKFTEGYTAGNYAEAYGGDDERSFKGGADQAHRRGKSYYYGWVLGFFGSYEAREVPLWAFDSYYEAFSEAGELLYDTGLEGPEE